MEKGRTPAPPTWMPRASQGLVVDVRRAIIPASLSLLALLWFGLAVPWWVLVLAALVVPSGYFAATVYVHRKWPAFEAEFNQHLMAGNVDALWNLYRDARLLRWLAPPHRAKLRLGMVLLPAEITAARARCLRPPGCSPSAEARRAARPARAREACAGRRGRPAPSGRTVAAARALPGAGEPLCGGRDVG